MRKNVFVKGTISLFAVAFLLAGCTAAPSPQKPAEEVLKDGLTALAEVKAYSYDVAFVGDITSPDGAGTKFNVKLSGQLDSLQPSDPKVMLKLDGSVTDSTGLGGSAKGEVRMNKENLYFNVMNLNMEGGEALPAEFTEMFGKWWMMPVPPGTFDELNVTLSAEDEAQQEKLKEALQKINLFATPEFVGTENVMGESSYHYRVKLDNEGLLQFAKAAAEAEGQTVSDMEMQQAREELSKVEIAGDVWVGTQSGVLNQFKGTIAMKGGAGEQSGTISLNVTIGDINKPVTIQAPADAEEFPLEALFGSLGMMGGGLPTDSTMTDDSMMLDESLMMDEAAMDANIEAMMESGVMEGDISEEELMKMMEGIELSQ